MCWDNVEGELVQWQLRDRNLQYYGVADAEVVPLQSLGVVDVAANGIKENEVLAHALANVSLSERAEGWAIKRSSDFVNEYPRRTAEDHFFMFQVFGVLQKRQLSEERAHKPLSNDTIRSFRHTLSAVRSKVMGTDESRIKIRSLIWGMCMMKNPPSIWLTINPADTQDPIAQVLCGQEIDLDHFAKYDERPSEIAITSDPYASASFFHFIINAILQELLGIKGSKCGQPIQREKGILGTIEAYIGTVEAQGRG
ncbi:hypothetical protein EI94DRAFT_1621851, partial [Lactarius quietus]